MWREHRGPFSLYGVGSQEAPHSPQKAVLGSVDMKSGWYHFSQLSQDTPQHHFHTSMHNWNHSSCPALAELREYFFFVVVVFPWRHFLLHRQLIGFFSFFLSYFSSPMCPPATRWRPPVPTPTVAVTVAVGEGNSWVKLTFTFAAFIQGLRTRTWSSSANRKLHFPYDYITTEKLLFLSFLFFFNLLRDWLLKLKLRKLETVLLELLVTHNTWEILGV